jgi:uncharacterized protein
MVRSLLVRLPLCLLGIVLFAWCGCARSVPVKYYTLSPLAAAGELTSEKEMAGRDLVIGIGPVRLPQYLERKEIVTRTSANNIDLAQYASWGGSLQDDFSRILLEDLSSLLRGNRVSLYEWPGTGTVDYRLGVDVVRFDGIPGGDVILIANWALREGRSNKVVKVQSSRIQEPTGAQSYEAMVGGMSGALGRLSLEIGEAITLLPR